MEKSKINSLELTGNLVSNPKITEKVAFLTIAVWNGKNQDGIQRKPLYVDAILFKPKLVSDYYKGQNITLKGKLSSRINKVTGYPELMVVAFSCDSNESVRHLQESGDTVLMQYPPYDGQKIVESAKIGNQNKIWEVDI